jgi:RNA polymerase sigma-70 factor (ECF subfamily)
LDDHLPGPAAGPREGTDPEREALLADAVGPALLVVLDTLSPGERLAFVLHDLFGVPFDEIAAILGRSPAAARQLASRARRRVRGADPDPGADRGRQRRVVDAFLAAARDGDFEALVALLDPDAVLRADAAAVQVGAAAEARGAAAVAGTFAGRARAARPALVDGVPGLVWAPGGRPRMAFAFSFAGGRIAAIELVADPERLRQVELAEASGD